MSNQLPPRKPWIVKDERQGPKDDLYVYTSNLYYVQREDYDPERSGDPDRQFMLLNEEEADSLAFLLNTRDRLLAACGAAEQALIDRKPFGVPNGEQVLALLNKTIAEAEGETPYEL